MGKPYLRPLPVDRILRKQKAERQAAEDAQREKAQQLALLGNKQEKSDPSKLIDHPLPSNSSSTSTLNEPPVSDGLNPRPQPEVSSPRPPSMIRSSLENWRKKFTGGHQQMPGGLPSNHDGQGQLPPPSLGSPVPKPSNPQATVTPQSNICQSFLLLPFSLRS